MRSRTCMALGLFTVLVALLLTGCGALEGPAIEVRDVWARPAMPGGGMEAGQGMGAAGTGAVFMRLINNGRQADRLVAGRTDVAEVVEIHETVMEGDVMKMQMLADGLEIPAQGEVLLQPGGYHVMLIGLQRDLAVGDRLSSNWSLWKAGRCCSSRRCGNHRASGVGEYGAGNGGLGFLQLGGWPQGGCGAYDPLPVTGRLRPGRP
jgi:copper(I)-binding protein